MLIRNYSFRLSQVYLASWISIQCGANFLKTSTGKSKHGGATMGSARTMLYAIRNKTNQDKEVPPAENRKLGLKISGGVRTAEDAKGYLELAKEVMGSSWPADTARGLGQGMWAEIEFHSLAGRMWAAFTTRGLMLCTLDHNLAVLGGRYR